MHPLDIFYRGTRDYIQGSQLISRGAAYLETAGARVLALTKAEFREIVREPVAASTVDTAGGRRALARMVFEQADTGATAVYLHPLAHAATSLRRVPDSPSQLTMLQFESAAPGALAQARASAKVDGSFESLLSAGVEFSKAVHVHVYPGGSDYWFSGAFDGSLPVTTGWARGTVELTLVIERAQVSPVRVLTISRASWVTVDGLRAELRLLYALRPGGAP